ncbi:hypothetical protein BLNAU_17031 [Blattamonas nauphoetae]|uniref:Uncharacterized protein n=1 Tax=Blattamonas nauphoetae TaxID=2049346 RepID=A0ABQ9XCP5_9EUKA|nr:hypothetical protein BLNAU_17031 [Blattamonas nauphoetae]
MPKDKNDQSQLNQFMNKIDGAVTRALQADYIRKGFEKCGLILMSPTKMLMSLRNVGQTFEEWKQTNTLQKKVDDELNVNSDDGLDCNWKNQIKGDHLDEWESFTVENDNSIPPLKPSASFPISGHVLSDPYFLHRWFEHNAAQKRVEEEREVARRARNERRRAATFSKLEKLQGKQVRRPPQHVSREFRVIHDDSSESSISLGHDEEFDDVAFIHDPNESDDDDSLNPRTTSWEKENSSSKLIPNTDASSHQ